MDCNRIVSVVVMNFLPAIGRAYNIFSATIQLADSLLREKVFWYSYREQPLYSFKIKKYIKIILNVARGMHCPSGMVTAGIFSRCLVAVWNHHKKATNNFHKLIGTFLVILCTFFSPHNFGNFRASHQRFTKHEFQMGVGSTLNSTCNLCKYNGLI